MKMEKDLGQRVMRIVIKWRLPHRHYLKKVVQEKKRGSPKFLSLEDGK